MQVQRCIRVNVGVECVAELETGVALELRFSYLSGFLELPWA
jgi:hypothetical protein